MQMRKPSNPIFSSVAAILVAVISSAACRQPLIPEQPEEGKEEVKTEATVPPPAKFTRLKLIKKREILFTEERHGFSWSPDGRRIAVGDRLSIQVYDVESPGSGKPLVQLQPKGPLADMVWISSVKWGSKDIVAYDYCFDVSCDTVLVSLDGTEIVSMRERMGPNWLPDGQRLLYSTPDGWRLYLWDMETRTETRIPWYPGEGHMVLDRDRLVYSVHHFHSRMPAVQPGLVLYNRRTKQITQLTNDGSDLPSGVAPDEVIIFARTAKYPREEYHLWAYNLATGEEGELWGEDSLGAQVSPSGKSLLCWTKPQGSSQYSLTLFELQNQ